MKTFYPEKEKKTLQLAVHKLPKDQQEVLELHFEKGLSVKEISMLLQCSVTTVYNKLHRAIFILKNQFDPAAFEKAYKILYPAMGKPASLSFK